jgi:hypothetical protein
MWFLAALTWLGGLIGGIALMAHTVEDCTSDTHSFCSGTTHDLIGVGATVLVTGLAQGSVLAAIGHIASGVSDVRAQLYIAINSVWRR